MAELTEPAKNLRGSSIWSQIDPATLLNDTARAIGVATGTDQGWTPHIESQAPPIGMAGGFPDAARLPVLELLDAIRAAGEELAGESMRYGGTSGFDGLRQCLAEQSRRVDGLEQSAENFILTNGSSAAIDIVCRALLNPGDIVIAESPSYSGSIRTIRGNGGLVEPVPLDADGLDTAELERLLASLEARGTPAKLIYTVPDYHNPTGASLSLDRRLQLIEVAARHRVLILEDDAYIDLYFGERPPPSLYALAEGEGVLRAGSFSKTLATGLRTGWLQGRADYVELCNQMRFDMGGSPLIYRALARYLASNRWEEHTAEMRGLYAAKCDALSEALIDECESYVHFQQPAGGYFLWLECAGGISARRVADAAAAQGLLCVPGHHFFLDKSEDRHIRIAFSAAPLSAMPEAARRLRLAFEQVAG